MAVEVNPNRPANINTASVASARTYRDWFLLALVVLTAFCLPLSLLILALWYGAGLLLTQGLTLGLPRQTLIDFISTTTPLFITAGLFAVGLASFFLARRRALHNPAFLDTLGCPSCGEDDLVRIRRQAADRALSSVGLPLRRYACRNCTWEGRRLHSTVPSVLGEVGVKVEEEVPAIESIDSGLSNGSAEWDSANVTRFETRETWADVERPAPQNGADGVRVEDFEHRPAESALPDTAPASTDDSVAAQPAESVEPHHDRTTVQSLDLEGATLAKEEAEAVTPTAESTAVDTLETEVEAAATVEPADADFLVEDLAVAEPRQVDREEPVEPDVRETTSNEPVASESLIVNPEATEPIGAQAVADPVDEVEQEITNVTTPPQADPAVQSDPVAAAATVVSPWGLSLYEEPSYESRVLTILKHGTSVDLLGGREQHEGVRWQEVEAGWQRGWVTDDFLEH